MPTGNKGEWSEFYTFIKLLSEKKVNAADENLMVSGLFYPILKINRDETGGVHEYEYLSGDNVKISIPGQQPFIVDLKDLNSITPIIFKEIKSNTSGTFSVSGAEELMSKLKINRLQAGNSRKEDLTLKIKDTINRSDPIVGFSIKSMLGAAPTLLNASRATNFIYEVEDFDIKNIESINSITGKSKVRKRLSKIIELGGKFKYAGMRSKKFEKNLRKIDSILPEIVAEMLLVYFYGLGSRMSELVEELVKGTMRIHNYNAFDKSDFEFKIKGLLNNVALGMVPNSEWSGDLRAHGGYIIVRDDGEIVCYSANNADDLRSYLFRNTKLDTSSTTRHDWGLLYEKDGRIFINLNLQIRFID